MRYSFYVALAALSFGLAGALPASAHWECQGPAASCISAKAPVTATKSVHYAKKAHKTASTKVRGHKSASHQTKSHKAARSYSGGGSRGMASYYWEGQRVASGGWFNPNAMTAAHKTLPFGTRVVVTNQRNGRSVTVTINDRGPYIRGRIIDLSRAAAARIGMTASGVAPVTMSVIGRG